MPLAVTCTRVTRTLNGALRAGVASPLVATRTKPSPGIAGLRPANAATPSTAVAVVDPRRACVGEYPCSPRVTTAPGTTFPNLSSRAVTRTAESNGTCPSTVPGCVRKDRRTGPGVTANGALVTGATPTVEAVSVYPPAALSNHTPRKVARPAVLVTVSVPPSVAPPGLAPSASVTGTSASVTRLPPPSRNSTLNAGFMESPATASLGPTTNANATISWSTVNMALPPT